MFFCHIEQSDSLALAALTLHLWFYLVATVLLNRRHYLTHMDWMVELMFESPLSLHTPDWAQNKNQLSHGYIFVLKGNSGFIDIGGYQTVDPWRPASPKDFFPLKQKLHDRCLFL